MADIERFRARAPRRGTIAVSADDGSAAALANVARISGQLAARLGQAADREAKREFAEKGAAAATAIEMPGVEFSYDGASAATTPTGDLAELETYIRGAASRRGIDPEIAVKVAKSEGLAPGVWQSNVVKNGRRERSYGPFQLYIDGGLGNEFQKLTGKSPADPSTVFKQIDFALDKAAELGWSPWYGAAKVGVGPRDGLANARAIGIDAAAAPGRGVNVALTGAAAPMPRLPAGSIAGDAYNAAAADIYVNRYLTAMKAQMDGLALQHENNPGALADALDSYGTGLFDDMEPTARAAIQPAFERYRFALKHESAQDHQRELRERTAVSFEEAITARTDAAYRMARTAGSDERSDAALAAELDALNANIDAAPLPPAAQARLKREAAAGVIEARVTGAFERIEDPAARARFAQELQREWLDGEGLVGQLDGKTFDRINTELARRLQADETAARKRTAALDKAVETQIGFLKKGWPVPAAERKRLSEAVAATGDPALAANLDFLDGLAGWQKAHIAARPEVVDAQIEAMRARIASDGITPAAQTTLDVMEGLSDQMRKGLATDPLGWAARAGVAEIEPLDFTDSATMAASLGERTVDARAVAAHYGIEPRFFTPAEQDGLKKMLAATPLALPSIVSALSAGLGDDTPAAMAEISTDAPVLAHIAGLVHATGDQRVAVEIAEALELRKTDGYKSALPPAGKLTAASAHALGGAFLAVPGAAPQVLEAAAALYEARIFARGLDTGEFDQEDDPARAAFVEALDEVLGANERGGVKFGGLADVNGFTTVAPPDLPADALQDLLDDLSVEDLEAQMPVATANGIAITPAQIRRGRLVMTTPGRYRVALGDVAAGDPRYVPAPGGYFELDVMALARSQARRGRDRTIYDGAMP
ncbi:MAG: hypothetical protein ABJ066_00930 [Nitratireductor sp.]